MKTKAQTKQTHCRNGHRLSGRNLQKIATRSGKRICRACRDEASRAYRKKKKSGAPISPWVKHGHARSGAETHEFRTWTFVIARCERSSRKDFKDYGAKGISLHPPWRNSFELFLREVGSAPSSLHTLDRFPNKTGNYEPGNVRWATRREQAQNRRDNVLLTLGSTTKCLAQWARELSINEHTIRSRLKRGWSVVRTLTSPRQGNHKEN